MKHNLTFGQVFVGWAVFCAATSKTNKKEKKNMV